MSVTGATLSEIGFMLKKNYHGGIVDTLNNMSVTFSMLEKTSEGVNGLDNEAVVSLRYRRPQGAGARADGGVLPSARPGKGVKDRIPLAYNYGKIEFTGPAMSASKRQPEAFANVVDEQINGMVEAMKIDINRQLIAPKSGYLCRTNGTGAGASSTVTVDTPGTMWLEEGMSIESFSDTTTAAAVSDQDISHGLTEPTAHKVGKILSSTTFRLDDYADSEITTEQWATDRFIFRYGSRAYESLGLMDLIDDYSLQATSSWLSLQLGLLTPQSQSRATYGILESNIRHNSNTNEDVSENMFQDLLDDIEKSSGKNNEKDKNLFMLTTYGVRKMFVDFLRADRRFTPNTLDLKGGWKSIAFVDGDQEIPMVIDKACTPYTCFVVDRRYMKIYRAGDFDWMDYDGSMFQRKIDSAGTYDAYEATLVCYLTLGCTSMKNQGARRDISES